MNIMTMHKNYYYYNSLSPAVHVTLILLITCNIVTSVSSQNHCHKPDLDALLSFKNALLDPSSRLISWLGHNCCSWPGIICHNNTARVVQIRLRNTPLDEGLGGQISASLLQLKHLHYLDLSSNNFQGIRIPEFLGSLHNLTYLNLSNANFTGGPIPQTIGGLSFLRYLDLSSYTSDQQEYNTNLDWLSGLHSLEYLNLGTVYLSHGWLQQVNMLPFLRELYLPSCGLSVGN